MDKMEMLARAWIDCDPNRAGERYSGFHPDDMNEPRGPKEMAKLMGVPEDELPPFAIHQGASDGEPRWKWFLPRAEALEAYIVRHGYKIVPIGDEWKPLPPPPKAIEE